MSSESEHPTNGAPGRRLSIDELRHLNEPLRRIEYLGDPTHRQALIGLLADELGPKYRLGSNELWEVLRRCFQLNALPQLVAALRLLVGDDEDVERFARAVDELAPSSAMTPAERVQLVTLLSELPAGVLTRVVEDKRLAPCRLVAGQSVTQLIDALENHCADGTGLELLIFLELAAHAAAPYQHLLLHKLVESVADRLQQGAAIDGICQQLFADATAVRQPATPNRSTEPVVPRSGPTSPASAASSASPARADAAEQPANHPAPAAASTDVGTGADTPNTSVDDAVDPAHLGDDVRTTAAVLVTEMFRLPKIMGGVPPQNPNFTGRQELMTELAAALHRDSQAAVLPHTLQGLGGIGKSQLATQYVRQYQADYDLIWWIPSDNERSIRRSLVSLARRLNMPESNDTQYTVEMVLDELGLGRPPYTNWLLVFDGANEPSEVAPYLPSASGHILITSRSRNWTNSTVVEVDVFTEDESVEFLTRRWPAMDRDDALSLANSLGRLPLALEQAVAVHRETGMPLAEYLHLLETTPLQVLAEGASDYVSVAKTLSLAFDQLKTHSLAAAQLLEVCVFLSSQPISVPMLARGRAAAFPSPLAETMLNEMKLRGAIRDIAKYALAQLDVGRDFIKIHMLVRAVLRDSMEPEEKAARERTAHEMLALATPGTPDDVSTWSQHAQVAPHVIPAGLIHSDDPHVQRVVLDQVRYYFVIGDYAESRSLAQDAVDNWRGRLGADDENTLIACFHLGNALRALGEYEAARTINQDTLSRMRRVLPPEHIYTFRAANSTAADHRLLGDFEAAKDLDETNLKLYREAFSEEDPATLRAANNLAVDYRLLGRFEDARKLDEQTLRTRSRVLPGENPEVLSSLASHARDLYGLGDYFTARDMLQQGLPKFERALSGHTFILLAKRYLAVVLRKTGDRIDALQLSEEVFAQCRTKFGPRHEHSLAATVTLSNTLRATGDLARARNLGEEALGLYRTQFGAEHPFTLACSIDLAIIYRALGQVEDATGLDRHTLDSLSDPRSLGRRHVYTISCLSNLATDLARAGQADEAVRNSREAYELSVAVRGDEHPNTLACAANLAVDLAEVGQHSDASTLAALGRAGIREKLGAEHPDTVTVERNHRLEFDVEVPPT